VTKGAPVAAGHGVLLVAEDSFIKVFSRSAVCHQFQPVSVSGEEKPYPGSEMSTTSKDCDGSPPYFAGSVNGPITLRTSQNVHGHPWCSSNGIGLGPVPFTWMKCSGTPIRFTLKCGSSFIARSMARQSYSSIQYSTKCLVVAGVVAVPPVVVPEVLREAGTA
jgi:hypothetical protein